MNARRLSLLALLAAAAPALRAQDGAAPQAVLQDVTSKAQAQLREAVAELDALRERMSREKIPLSRRLSELEGQLVQVRQDHNQAARLLDTRTLDLANLRGDIERREEEASYLSNLLGEYIRNFEAGLHIAELQRYQEALEAARLAPENGNLSQLEVFRAQTGLLETSLARLEEALGGARFEGTAVDPQGLVRQGTFLLVGPTALFRTADGAQVGTAEQRLGSLEPTLVPFADPEDAAAASALVVAGRGVLPLDPTLGNAHKIEGTEETLWEHIQAGGPVMVPIFVLAAAALLVALYKWIAMAFTRRPSRKQIAGLLDALGRRDVDDARARAEKLRGPVGRMLRAGVEHLGEPRALIEEVMYEQVLTTRLKLERMLPFIAVSAASAPLLGLLGTVTGIITTFKMITVFGSGDVKTLSGGISEALITTEFGLIVAIPSLLLHAFLSRKARGVVNQMEAAAVALLNQVGRARLQRVDDGEGEATDQGARLPEGPEPDEVIVPSTPAERAPGRGQHGNHHKPDREPAPARTGGRR